MCFNHKVINFHENLCLFFKFIYLFEFLLLDLSILKDERVSSEDRFL
jgi:hypothetical protein